MNNEKKNVFNSQEIRHAIDVFEKVIKTLINTFECKRILYFKICLIFFAKNGRQQGNFEIPQNHILHYFFYT